MAEKKITSYPKEKINILFLENISDAAVKHFNAAGYASVKKINGALSEDELAAAIKDVHLLGIRSKTLITKKVLENSFQVMAIHLIAICQAIDLLDKSEKEKISSNTKAVYTMIRKKVKFITEDVSHSDSIQTVCELIKEHNLQFWNVNERKATV